MRVVSALCSQTETHSLSHMVLIILPVALLILNLFLSTHADCTAFCLTKRADSFFSYIRCCLRSSERYSLQTRTARKSASIPTDQVCVSAPCFLNCSCLMFPSIVSQSAANVFLREYRAVHVYIDPCWEFTEQMVLSPRWDNIN